ncbi:hypothetical protein TNIN_382091 [Trichonephila inaurata madagascariensis]|uniref:Uncharacterized protein n=1 Tax=Trichonephila inaurata madagascariensis TaxID=2747483 RepID=A0A8X6Y2T6_9ARAC|nr:hypothetical protein TNIN_382091 [Trichonephila inaurata madagascariensis]
MIHFSDIHHVDLPAIPANPIPPNDPGKLLILDSRAGGVFLDPNPHVGVVGKFREWEMPKQMLFSHSN